MNGEGRIQMNNGLGNPWKCVQYMSYLSQGSRSHFVIRHANGAIFSSAIITAQKKGFYFQQLPIPAGIGIKVNEILSLNCKLLGSNQLLF